MKHSRATNKNPSRYYFDLNLPEHKEAAKITAMTSSMNAAAAFTMLATHVDTYATNLKNLSNHMNYSSREVKLQGANRNK